MAIIQRVCLVLGLVALAGCDRLDPLQRPYMWHETEVNAHNIAAMAVNPADLIHGRGQARRPARMETNGVERLWTGKALPLPMDTPGATSGGTTTNNGGT
jgi:type IV pilus biogenesis protein CpaD/CtpE